MKKLLGLLLMGAAMFSSCGNDHEDLYDPNAAALIKANEYSKAFIAKFGNIDPNHTWGFGDALGSRIGMNVNANEWAGYANVPDPLTDEQKSKVAEWFKNNKNPQSVSVKWCDYFAQYVSSTQYGEFMNNLQDAEVHLNNFNGGSQGQNSNVWNGELKNPNDQNSKVYHSDRILYVQGGSTGKFSCQISTDGSTCTRFVIVPGDLIDSSVAGMYFLGFDYSCSTNNIVEADGYYNDWIIKLTPCEYINSYRIIAEDLGEIGDFDFNDVVFDVYIEENDGNTDDDDNAVVTLLAAGGTLPLYVAGKEVHELFGVSPDEMVNTGKGPNRTPVIFRVPNISNILNIEIKVVDGDSEYELEVKRGKAAQKICVSTDFEYPAEGVNIDTIYEFSKYANNEANELKKK